MPEQYWLKSVYACRNSQPDLRYTIHS